MTEGLVTRNEEKITRINSSLDSRITNLQKLYGLLTYIGNYCK